MNKGLKHILTISASYVPVVILASYTASSLSLNIASYICTQDIVL